MVYYNMAKGPNSINIRKKGETMKSAKRITKKNTPLKVKREEVSSVVKLTETDEKILASYEIFLEGIAAFWGNSCEYVLHRFDDLDHSVVQIINGYHSNRSVGSPITNHTLEQLNNAASNDIVHHYMTHSSTSPTGEMIRSVTIPIVGEENWIIGMICINFHTGSSIASLLSGYCGGNEEVREGANAGHVAESFAADSGNLIHETLEEVRAKVCGDDSIRVLDRNRIIIEELWRRGIFNLKNSVTIVANSLKLTKNTVYLYVRKMKFQ